MRRLVAVVTLLACSNQDSARIAALEKRVDEVEQREKADHEKLLEGIAENSNRISATTVEPHWWCIGGTKLCFRDKSKCDEMPHDAECTAVRVAFCPRKMSPSGVTGTSGCMGTLALCEQFASDDCIGVE